MDINFVKRYIRIGNKKHVFFIRQTVEEALRLRLRLVKYCTMLLKKQLKIWKAEAEGFIEESKEYFNDKKDFNVLELTDSIYHFYWLIDDRTFCRECERMCNLNNEETLTDAFFLDKLTEVDSKMKLTRDEWEYYSYFDSRRRSVFDEIFEFGKYAHKTATQIKGCYRRFKELISANQRRRVSLYPL